MFTDLLEQRVNDFIKDKNVIDIKYQAFLDENITRNSVLVIYEENECEECKIES